MTSLGSKSCPKCGRAMEDGFVIDKGDYDTPRIGAWHPGEPDKRWYGLKIDKARKKQIVTYRCTSCSYLENYAP